MRSPALEGPPRALRALVLPMSPCSLCSWVRNLVHAIDRPLGNSRAGRFWRHGHRFRSERAERD
eukprot:12192862-Alexandrium_andersonii.AAC.1